MAGDEFSKEYCKEARERIENEIRCLKEHREKDLESRDEKLELLHARINRLLIWILAVLAAVVADLAVNAIGLKNSGKEEVRYIYMKDSDNVHNSVQKK